MKRLRNKGGKIGFDSIIAASVLAFVVFICVASGMFYYNRHMDNSGQADIFKAYNNIIVQMRLDSHQAVVALTEATSAVLIDRNTEQICKYEFKKNELIRTGKVGDKSVLLKDIESVTFSSGQDLPNLLSVKIFPLNRQEIPFFTSFALRGSNNDMQ